MIVTILEASSERIQKMTSEGILVKIIPSKMTSEGILVKIISSLDWGNLDFLLNDRLARDQGDQHQLNRSVILNK